jgi:two-component system sensor kinase FixL
MHQDERGRPVATLETNKHITERKRAEEALNKTQADLAHVTRVTTLGEMTASIAHEINQPLAAVITNGSDCLRWLAGATSNLDEAREAVGRIIRDGNRGERCDRTDSRPGQESGTEQVRVDIKSFRSGWSDTK